jgi:hypothetical protein
MTNFIYRYPHFFWSSPYSPQWFLKYSDTHTLVLCHHQFYVVNCHFVTINDILTTILWQHWGQLFCLFFICDKSIKMRERMWKSKKIMSVWERGLSQRLSQNGCQNIITPSLLVSNLSSQKRCNLTIDNEFSHVFQVCPSSLLNSPF